ncbi:hypothetical protein D3C72_829610 [compost metagenome]
MSWIGYAHGPTDFPLRFNAFRSHRPARLVAYEYAGTEPRPESAHPASTGWRIDAQGRQRAVAGHAADGIQVAKTLSGGGNRRVERSAAQRPATQTWAR